MLFSIIQTNSELIFSKFSHCFVEELHFHIQLDIALVWFDFQGPVLEEKDTDLSFYVSVESVAALPG